MHLRGRSSEDIECEYITRSSGKYNVYGETASADGRL